METGRWQQHSRKNLALILDVEIMAVQVWNNHYTLLVEDHQSVDGRWIEGNRQLNHEKQDQQKEQTKRERINRCRQTQNVTILLELKVTTYNHHTKLSYKVSLYTD